MVKYNKIYLTKFQKELNKNGITVPAKEFLEEAFNLYLSLQLEKAKKEVSTLGANPPPPCFRWKLEKIRRGLFKSK